jgi:hypothetical protein
MIIRAEKVQRRIEQSRLLQSEINRIGPLRRAQSTGAQALIGLPGIFVFIRQPGFQTPLTTTLEYTQDVSRLRNLPARQRIEKREDSFQSSDRR